MSKENKTVELKDEELEKVTGGQVGNCGITITIGQCQQYDSSNPQCIGCPGKPTRSSLDASEMIALH